MGEVLPQSQPHDSDISFSLFYYRYLGKGFSLKKGYIFIINLVQKDFYLWSLNFILYWQNTYYNIKYICFIFNNSFLKIVHLKFLFWHMRISKETFVTFKTDAYNFCSLINEAQPVKVKQKILNHSHFPQSVLKRFLLYQKTDSLWEKVLLKWMKRKKRPRAERRKGRGKVVLDHNCRLTSNPKLWSMWITLMLTSVIYYALALLHMLNCNGIY